MTAPAANAQSATHFLNHCLIWHAVNPLPKRDAVGRTRILLADDHSAIWEDLRVLLGSFMTEEPTLNPSGVRQWKSATWFRRRLFSEDRTAGMGILEQNHRQRAFGSKLSKCLPETSGGTKDEPGEIMGATHL
jgi:hypothetical protein